VATVVVVMMLAVMTAVAETAEAVAVMVLVAALGAAGVHMQLYKDACAADPSCQTSSHVLRCSNLCAGSVRAYFKGNGTNVLKIAPETSIKLGLNDYLRHHIHADTDSVAPWERMLCGGISGAVGQVGLVLWQCNSSSSGSSSSSRAEAISRSQCCSGCSRGSVYLCVP
jgi:hypothetical protein